MPPEEQTHAELLIGLGKLQGKTDAIEKDIVGVKNNIGKIFDKMDENTKILTRIEINSERAKKDASEALKRVEDIKLAPHPVVLEPALHKTKPWEKPLGDLAGEIMVGSLKLIGIGVVVYLIVLGVTNGTI